MTTHAEREATLARIRLDRKRGAYPYTTADDLRTQRVWSIAGWCAASALIALIGFGLWHRFVPNDDSFVHDVVAQCRAQGYSPTVERAADGHVLGVRCNRWPEGVR